MCKRFHFHAVLRSFVGKVHYSVAVSVRMYVCLSVCLLLSVGFYRNVYETTGTKSALYECHKE